jgi:pimeloyl-ACP methyl ester carboxylesterase
MACATVLAFVVACSSTPPPSQPCSDGRTLTPRTSAPPLGSSEPASASDDGPGWPAKTLYRTVNVGGHRIFYREAGAENAPTVLLLHGYPSSSHTYRELIPLLSGRYHVIAPDNLGSGFSDHPAPDQTDYSFDLLSDVMAGFVEELGLERYVLYMQDFGAPVGFRLAMRHPERIQALVVQNANAYLDGLTPPRQEFFRRAHEDQSAEHVASLAAWVSNEAIRDKQYLRDVPGARAERMSPDTWTHDIAMLQSEADRLVQVALFRDYQTNIDAYPKWQAYLREHSPPTLIVWGERDPAFIADGARAYLRDVPDAELHLLDAGHFAAEEDPVGVAKRVISFVDRL